MKKIPKEHGLDHTLSLLNEGYYFIINRSERRDAAPIRIQKTLFGQGGVQCLDGAAHRQRKNMFMRLMNDNAMQEISTSIHKHWKKYFNHISESENINMYEASKSFFTNSL